jgi:OOP family OmpA-OmpF porin
MKRFIPSTEMCAASCLIFFTALAAACLPVQARAEDGATKDVRGPYLGLAFGGAFGNRESSDSNSSNDEGIGRSAKIYGGYQLSENFGLQAGFVRMRDLNQNTGKGATLLIQTASGQSVYAAGTARLPLGDSFALTGKVGVSFGKVSSANPATAASNKLLGSKTSLLVGSGVEYVVNRQASLSLELESYGNISPQVKGNLITLGVRFTF